MNGNVEKLACILCAAEMFCEGCDRCGDQRKYYHVAQAALGAITCDVNALTNLIYELSDSIAYDCQNNTLSNMSANLAKAIASALPELIVVREGVQK